MHTRLLSGNEAVALGAWEAGVAVGCGYPGTPSTEILEALAGKPGVYTEWSVNEKVALEVGVGAALAGGRTLVTMKHVGVNVAADPLFTASYTGVRAGLVIVTADDPELHSSQNEQDNRNYAIAAKVPMLEPSDSQEAREFTRLAFELSETFDTPVFLRMTTRLSHSKSLIEPFAGDAPQRTEAPLAPGFEPDPRKYVMIPGHARARRVAVEDRMQRLIEAAEDHPANRIEWPDGLPADAIAEFGVITSGIPYSYVKEVAPQAPVLKLGLVHPLPRRLLAEFAARVRWLYVVEELDPVIETQLKAWGIDCVGREAFSGIGEFSPTIVARGLGRPLPAPTLSPQLEVTVRRPGLCPGCPHDHVFTELRRLGFIVSGDIGCYSLGVLPPYNAMDTLLDMGASLTMAQGMDLVVPPEQKGRIAAVIGDSTFAHSGITGLLNAVWNGRDGLYVVLDNGTTAMTGMQPNPLSGERMGRSDAPSLDYALLAKAMHIPDDRLAMVDAYDTATISAALEHLAGQSGVRLLVVLGLCLIEGQKLKRIEKLDLKKTVRRELVRTHPLGGQHE
ncbi:indolepyruvate ferredoxin oxidoreductase alpha subunit [Propionicimonas paludicola]|uniref:Indolepyruvate oxidoreductase subunit IorA n=1 Tax=Propionicimonas paludicola TaxID=185243 RepID=A0A2A9CP11_9ACTN|nr:thiamine pyrophosphate-dependent enzyme [Propionicimonas paludicola]PFG16197.1 indolepyruvate ferredoxin oxidoreductase alpha subunit [Propionicimonas paludicola]